MHRFAIRLYDERMLALANYIVLPVDPGSKGETIDLTCPAAWRSGIEQQLFFDP